MKASRFLAILVLTCTATLARAAEGTSFQVGGLTFTAPEGWEHSTPTSPMRKAVLTFTSTDPAGTAETVFFYFGPEQGGSAEDNIQRWRGQVQNPTKDDVSAETVGDTKVTFLHMVGTYLSGMPGGPKTPQADTVLLGGIIEKPTGNIFVRLTGPAALAANVEPAFRKMLTDAAR